MRVLVLATATFLFGNLMTLPEADAESSRVVEERQELMKEFGRHLGVAKKFAQEGEGTSEEVAEAAESIAERAEEIPALFPEGTAMGEVEVETEALPAIWEDPDDFAAKSRALREAALAFAEVAANGATRQDIGAGMAQLGREGCGDCHHTYREDDHEH